MRNYAGTFKGICSYNLVYNFLIQLLPLKSSVFVVHFSNAFWHGNKAFPKVSSQNEIVPLLVIFHLTYGKYSDVKICFFSFRYQNQNFSLVSYSCRSCALMQHSCRSCGTRVALVLHQCCQCRTRVARIWHSCCKLAQILKVKGFFSSFIWQFFIRIPEIIGTFRERFIFQIIGLFLPLMSGFYTMKPRHADESSRTKQRLYSQRNANVNITKIRNFLRSFYKVFVV